MSWGPDDFALTKLADVALPGRDSTYPARRDTGATVPYDFRAIKSSPTTPHAVSHVSFSSAPPSHPISILSLIAQRYDEDLGAPAVSAKPKADQRLALSATTRRMHHTSVTMPLKKLLALDEWRTSRSRL